MTEKEEKILKIINEYIKENTTIPTRNYIQNKLKFRSVNSVTQYLKSLENKGYLSRNKFNKLAINGIHCEALRKIKIINWKNNYLNIILNKKKNYVAYRLNNNYFTNDNILKNDVLVIEKEKKLTTDDIGLFIIDYKYRIMKYNYQDGFYVLEDKEKLILNHVTIIGKVVQIIRKI